MAPTLNTHSEPGTSPQHGISPEHSTSLQHGTSPVYGSNLAYGTNPAYSNSPEHKTSSEHGATPRSFHVTHHAFDDSVFIDNQYVVKGVPGRLLMFLLETYKREGRREFTNRELRLSSAIRLPDIKDNLESRLLLLRRRLEDKSLPVQLRRIGRGRIILDLTADPVFVT
jgi:adenylate cyclase